MSRRDYDTLLQRAEVHARCPSEQAARDWRSFMRRYARADGRRVRTFATRSPHGYVVVSAMLMDVAFDPEAAVKALQARRERERGS